MNYKNSIVQNDMKELADQSDIPVNLLQNKKILITGANGMLATYLIYFFMYLNEKKHLDIEIFAVSRNKKKAEERFQFFLADDRFHLLIGDVCNRLEIGNKKNIDYIIHAAGNASPHFIMNDPVGIIKANTLGTLNVLEFAKENNCSRVLYTSTREIYGALPESVKLISEEKYGVINPTQLRNCYPESKRLSETLLESYRFQYNIEYVTVRIAHSYGPGMTIENDGRVMADFISDTIHERNIVLKSKGEMERAFCYITDAVSGILFALLVGQSGNSYNLANETEPISVRKVAELLVQLFPGTDRKVEFKIPEQADEGYSKIERTKLDTRKLEALGWKSRIALKEGLTRTVQSFKE